jgi:NAD(P)-dependent dehydrogenase (short-subunit alcohol dehydrogenase family)
VTELAVESFGQLDGIVINHGVLAPMTKIVDADVREWKRLYDANLFSAVALVRTAWLDNC